VSELAAFLARSLEADSLSTLAEINRRWPALSFVGAVILAQAMSMRTEGNA